MDREEALVGFDFVHEVEDLVGLVGVLGVAGDLTQVAELHLCTSPNKKKKRGRAGTHAKKKKIATNRNAQREGKNILRVYT